MTDRWHAPLTLTLLLLAGLTATAQDADDLNHNEHAAIGALKAISTSQSLFREGDKDNNNELDYAPNLQALADTGLIDNVLGSGTKNGYRFKVTVSPKSPEFLWMATAAPVKAGVTGQRYFAMSHEGVIYHSLKPFTHNAECKVTGVPVGKQLQGWVKKIAKPEGPWGKAFQAGVAANLWKGRSRRGLHFLLPNGRLMIGEVRVYNGGRHRLETIRLNPKTMRARVQSSRFDGRARLKRLKIESMTFPQRGKRPDPVREVLREGSTVMISEPGSTAARKVAWKPNTITLDQALFVLPRLHAYLPATLTVNLAKDGEPMADPLKVGVSGSGGDKTVSLTHAKLGEAVVIVKGGAVQSLKGFDGVTWKAVSLEEARKAFMKHLKGPAAKNLKEAILAGNEAAAIGALKTIGTAQMLFREGDKDRNNELDYAGDLAALGKTQLIDGVLAKGTKQGFKFKVTRSKKTPEFLWMATAAPVEMGKSGSRYFATNHEGVIYHSLTPFTHTEDCKVTGVPVGRTLPGWKRPAAKGPALPATGETRAIGVMRTISTAQTLFREADKEGDGNLDYAQNLKELFDAKLLAEANLKRSGYTFKVCAGSDAPEFLWMAIAAPNVPGKTGNRYFVTNHTGVTFYSDKPIKLDTKKCEIPKGLKPLGR